MSKGVHTSDDGESIDIATLAAVHEFGSDKMSIPERSFLRKTYANYSKEFEQFVAKNKDKIAQEIIKHGVDYVLGKFGAWWVNKVEKTFEAQGPGWAALSPKYLKQKQKRYPNAKILMSTGALRRAITHAVEDK